MTKNTYGFLIIVLGTLCLGIIIFYSKDSAFWIRFPTQCAGFGIIFYGGNVLREAGRSSGQVACITALAAASAYVIHDLLLHLNLHPFF